MNKVGHPMRRVHVVSAAAVIARFLAQVEEVLDIGVPKFDVAAERAGPFAALIHRDADVVGDLEERNDAGRFAVRAVDMRAAAAHRGPRATESARPLGERGEAGPRLGYFLDGIAAIEQVAARELRAVRAGIEERRRGRAGALVLVNAVEFLRARASRSVSSRARPIATRIQKICGDSTRRRPSGRSASLTWIR